MPYTDRFKSTDDLIPDMDRFVPGLRDHILKSRYIGLLAIAGVTVYELAIKDILYAFAEKKHTALGAAARYKFDKLNGRIKIKSLKNEHTMFFGKKYSDRYSKRLEITERLYLINNKASIKSSYGNLIQWRHNFAHQAIMTATYEEVKNAYIHGKEVLHCLNEVMVY